MHLGTTSPMFAGTAFSAATMAPFQLEVARFDEAGMGLDAYIASDGANSFGLIEGPRSWRRGSFSAEPKDFVVFLGPDGGGSGKAAEFVPSRFTKMGKRLLARALSERRYVTVAKMARDYPGLFGDSEVSRVDDGVRQKSRDAMTAAFHLLRFSDRFEQLVPSLVDAAVAGKLTKKRLSDLAALDPKYARAIAEHLLSVAREAKEEAASTAEASRRGRPKCNGDRWDRAGDHASGT